MPASFRTSLGFVALALGTMGVGLIVHRGGTALHPAARDILGDALWAMMIAWWIAALDEFRNWWLGCPPSPCGLSARHRAVARLESTARGGGWIAALIPNPRPWTRAGLALAVCWVVELSQLYHAPGLDAMRQTTAGHLVLGNGFDPRDLVAYAVGVLVAVMIEASMRSRRSTVPEV